LNSAFDAAREFVMPDPRRVDRAAALREYVEQAFETLHMPIFHYLRSLTGNAAEAEDLTQEVFLRLHAELGRGRRIESLKPWCFKVAHNLAASMGRRQQTEAQYAEAAGGETPPFQAGAEESLLQKEQAERIALAMDKLSSMERQCLYLRTEGLLYREIAEVLGVRIPSVQTFLARAMKKVVKELHG
jgi:RNA polymerase sigma-70 factor (ECF subfamily)